MTEADIDIIRRFAAEDNTLRQRAIDIYQREAARLSLLDPGLAEKETGGQAVPFLFMAEIVSEHPDYRLRYRLRRRLVVELEEQERKTNG